ncbi:hypothetical protein [Pantoea endophytica]|uniref:hypothetical protein n=1 Tax=Pantoea endophytica TaxID=92488 RepID=UPI001304194E|nr:hypothetical protein [Pantoea endophytica]
MFEVAVFQNEVLLFAFNIAAEDEEAAEETVSRLNEINPDCQLMLVCDTAIGLG